MRGGPLEWESEVGVRVGVRNRLGEAVGKPVANLRERWTPERVEKRLKRTARHSGFQQTDLPTNRFSSIFAEGHRGRGHKINGKSNYKLAGGADRLGRYEGRERSEERGISCRLKRSDDTVVDPV